MSTPEPKKRKVALTTMDELKDGALVRAPSTFRNFVGTSEYPVEKDRYHLYVSYACPWASRCLAVRALKGLEDVISLSVVSAVFQKTNPDDEEDKHFGWAFVDESEEAGAIPDTVMGTKTIRELYEKIDPLVQKFSVPVLFDKKSKTIVNNESAEIIRMFNNDFNSFAKNPDLNLYPKDLAEKIEEVNEWIYPGINNGVYRCGFAQKQGPYDQAVKELFDALDKCEDILLKQRYLTSNDRITEADIRFFVTIVRFDEVYHGHFKCNKKRIADYPSITGYMREIYQMPGMSKTVNMKHIKDHYHRSHPTINPFGIVPVGPDVLSSLLLPHGREKLN